MKIILIFFTFITCNNTYSSIEVFFNRGENSYYIDPYKDRLKKGIDLESILISEIKNSKHSIDIAIQEMSLKKLIKTIINKKKEGVKVRIIIENKYNNHFYNPLLLLLEESGIPIIDDTFNGSKGSGLMHHKFVVIDRKITLISSANFTQSGIHGDSLRKNSFGNSNAMIKIKNKKVSLVFLDEFQQMWNPKFHRFKSQKIHSLPYKVDINFNEKISILFSPRQDNSIEKFIESKIKMAKKHVKAAYFVFSSKDISSSLQKNKNIIKEVIQDKSFIKRSYSISKRYLSQENFYFYYPKINTHDKFHHKFMVIDDETVLFGSYNMTQSAAKKNDETLIYIKSKNIANQFSQEFNFWKRNSRKIPLLKK